MNDITALMGKLKANIAYLQFDESGAQDRVAWPVLQRLARTQDGENEATAAAPDEAQVRPEAIRAPSAPEVSAAAPGASLLKRYAPPASADALPPADSKALADIFARLARKPR